MRSCVASSPLESESSEETERSSEVRSSPSHPRPRPYPLLEYEARHSLGACQLRERAGSQCGQRPSKRKGSDMLQRLKLQSDLLQRKSVRYYVVQSKKRTALHPVTIPPRRKIPQTLNHPIQDPHRATTQPPPKGPKTPYDPARD